MKKRLILTGIIISVILLIGGLYTTLSTDTTITGNDDDTYYITLDDNSNGIVTLPALSSKTIIYKIKNTNNGTVAYGVGYTASSGIKVKKWYDSLDDVSGLIEKDEYKFIKLKISNYNNTTEEVQISTILGYETGGDLIVPESTILVSETINETNSIIYDSSATSTSVFLKTSIIRNTIDKLEFVYDNIVPIDAVGSKDISRSNDGSVMMWWYNNDDMYQIYIGTEGGKISLTDSNGTLFRYLSNVKELKISNIDTSNMTSMYAMFYGCSSLTSLDLSNFDTTSVTTMGNMFYNCSSLTTLDLSNFDTTNVTDMGNMFYGCSSLTNLDLSNFDTTSVTTMGSMFFGCSSLTTLDLSNFDTTNVTTMVTMFFNCSSLTNLDLSNFTGESLTNTSSMFSCCSKLTNIDMRNITFSSVNTYSSMFKNVPTTSQIIVKDTTNKNILKNDFGYSTRNILTVDEYNAL